MNIPIIAVSILLIPVIAVACDVETGESTPTERAVQATSTNRTATATNTPTPTSTSNPTDTATTEPEIVEEPLPDALVAAAGPILAHRAEIISVADGDTMNVRINGEAHGVRLIGVDTPETVDPNEPVQCYGPEASDFTAQQLAGFEYVYMEKDITNTDRYGRLLRYVWLPDGRMLNKELLFYGFGVVSTYPPDVKYVDQFTGLQEDARNNLRGLWGNCPEHIPTATPAPPPTSTPVPPTSVPQPTSPPPAGNCDPSYPTVCIAPYPPDLDCGEIPYRRFEVRPPDPHGFDRDNDGVGCESG